MTIVALSKILNRIGVFDYTLTETRINKTNSMPAVAVNVSDEDAMIIALRYSESDIVDEINATSNEMLDKLKSYQK